MLGALGILVLAFSTSSSSSSSSSSVLAGLKEWSESSESVSPELPTWSGMSCVSCESPHCDPGPYQHVSVCTNAHRCYTSQIRDTRGVVHRSKGCTRDWAHTALHCSVTSYDGRHALNDDSHSYYNDGDDGVEYTPAQYAMSCCSEELCNDDLTTWPKLPPLPVLSDDEDESGQGSEHSAFMLLVLKLALAIGVPIFVFVVAGLFALVFMKRRHDKNMALINAFDSNNGHGSNVDEALLGLRAQPVGDSTLRELQGDGTVSSGSGSGCPQMKRRTLAKEIRLNRKIGQGKYGQVWHAEMHGDAVAVKIFFSRDYNSWRRETEIYTTVQLRHENILGLIGSDFTSVNSCTQFWLVTHFYPMGSLYDFLSRAPTDVSTALSLVTSALSGLLHLHTSFEGTKGKPSIAHRDVKSKNILVKNDGRSCVLADFGLALLQCSESSKTSSMNTQSENESQMSFPSLATVSSNTQVGTKRYMSPEVLDMTLHQQQLSFEAHRRSDIYSFALVMWEVLRRTQLSNDEHQQHISNCALPYYQYVSPDPSFDEMRRAVCEQRLRPEIEPRWQRNKVTRVMSDLMRECWSESPSSRLTALALKKGLNALKPSLQDEDVHCSSQQPVLLSSSEYPFFQLSSSAHSNSATTTVQSNSNQRLPPLV